MWIAECWRRYVSPPGDGYWPWHRPQRHAVLLHNCWKPGPDLPNGPCDRRDGDTSGPSGPRAPARVSTHCHGGRWWDPASIGKMQATAMTISNILQNLILSDLAMVTWLWQRNQHWAPILYCFFSKMFSLWGFWSVYCLIITGQIKGET